MQELYMSNLNGEPPTDDLCFGYAMCTIEHLVQWRTQEQYIDKILKRW